MYEYADRIHDIALLLIAAGGVVFMYGTLFAKFVGLFRRVFCLLFGRQIAAARERRGETWVQAVLRPISEEGPLTSGFIPSVAYVVLWAMLFIASFRMLLGL